VYSKIEMNNYIMPKWLQILIAAAAIIFGLLTVFAGSPSTV
jgi:uncharacterized membrane protein YqiK